MDIFQKRDFIYTLRNVSRCLGCTREDVIDALSDGLIDIQDATEIKSIVRMLDAADANKNRNYKPGKDIDGNTKEQTGSVN